MLESENPRPAEQLPLTLPQELWSSLSPAEQAVYRRAEALMGMFSITRSVALSRFLAQGPRTEVLRALQVLGGMSLVDVDQGEPEPSVTLRALPESHVRIVGPDGRARWVFVARPLDPPTVDPNELN
jgi:hypothetical protein